MSGQLSTNSMNERLSQWKEVNAQGELDLSKY